MTVDACLEARGLESGSAEEIVDIETGYRPGCARGGLRNGRKGALWAISGRGMGRRRKIERRAEEVLIVWCQGATIGFPRIGEGRNWREPYARWACRPAHGAMRAVITLEGRAGVYQEIWIET